MRAGSSFPATTRTVRPGSPGIGDTTESSRSRLPLPGSAAQVAACVRWADEHDVPFAVRSGGHSFAGQSSSKGLLIDLRRLSGISPSGDKARVGAGARLGAVYAALWAAGHRTIPGGTAPTVGVAGLTLGGGHGFLARRLGLACDNVVAMEVVTADGKVRTCNATSNKDLFWALRGAGFGSFGVVTSLTFKTAKLGPVATVALEWEWPRAAEIVASWTKFMATAPDELSTVLALRVPAVPGGVPRLAVNGLFVGTKADALAAIEPLLTATMPSKVTVVQRPWDAAVRYFEGNQSEKTTVCRRGVRLCEDAAHGTRARGARRPRRGAPCEPEPAERRCGALRTRRSRRTRSEERYRVRPS